MDKDVNKRNELRKQLQVLSRFNADFNAARNIAMSTLWMETGQVTEKSKQEAREYYGISKKYEQNKNDSENNKVA